MTDEERKINNMQKRDNMLENLLNILNSAAALGLGPVPGELGKQWPEQTEVQGGVGGKKGLFAGLVLLRLLPRIKMCSSFAVLTICV